MARAEAWATAALGRVVPRGRGIGVFEAGRPDKQPGGDGPEGGDSPARTSRMPGRRVIALGLAAAVVVAAGAVIALTHNSPGSHQSAAASQGAQPASGPIRVESITPAQDESGVDGAAPITVTFSAPIASNSPDPTLQPNVPGTWSAIGDSLVFQPQSAFGPTLRVTVAVPSGPAGVRSAGGGLLTTAVTEHFTTGTYSQLRLAQLLAELGYLPMTWTAADSGAARAEASYLGAWQTTQVGQAYDPPAGTFQWAPGYPATLTSLWAPDQPNVIVRGAVMAFQSEHGMTINGEATPRLWSALFTAEELGQQNANGYSYAIASKSVPETLTIWHDGHVVLRSLANTGIPVSPTVDGTFPVFERFRFQIMRGTNPDGSAYADPVSFVSYFNGGDAVHYFPRGSYGFQQSLGCVELPYKDAELAFPYLTYGSLVSVTG